MQLFFLISPSDSLLVVSRNVTDFFILIFYPVTLLNLLVLTFFLVEPLGFSICNITSSSNRDNFNSSFLIWIPFTVGSHYPLGIGSRTPVDTMDSQVPYIKWVLYSCTVDPLFSDTEPVDMDSQLYFFFFPNCSG